MPDLDAKTQPIFFINRATGKREQELVYGGDIIAWLYQNPIGQGLSSVLTRKWISQVYGAVQSRRSSAKKIPDFISKFQIPMDLYESGPFQSFNDFFIRKFRSGARSFASDPKQMGAFAEGRYAAFEALNDQVTFPVKGEFIRPMDFLKGVKDWSRFENGPGFVARLCPVDYHRFHFPDDGNLVFEKRIHGPFHSVNPMALTFKPSILSTNERHVSILETKNFGLLAYIEVGALCVGKIVQTHSGPSFKKGDEKGYFLFGASTVVVLGEPQKWKPAADLIKNTRDGIETLVRLGEPIAQVL
ncbi:MAG: phosphatidylserine decarboxylase [Oligoflexia bacterium]|nr:phosphatidylserine decarboxylase [Oligoflexia bacterium]